MNLFSPQKIAYVHIGYLVPSHLETVLKIFHFQILTMSICGRYCYTIYQPKMKSHTERVPRISVSWMELHNLTALPASAIWLHLFKTNVTHAFISIFKSKLQAVKRACIATIRRCEREKILLAVTNLHLKKKIKQIIPVQIGKTWQDHQEQGFLHPE